MQVGWAKNAVLDEWLRCIQVYSVVNRTSREVTVWKTKPRRTAESVEPSPRRPSSVVRTRGRRSVCDGLDVIRRRRREVEPPLVITPVLRCRGTSYRTEPGGYFCWTLTLTRTPDPIQPTRRGPDPNRPTNGSKQGGSWPRGCLSAGFWSATAGDNRRQQNRI